MAPAVVEEAALVEGLGLGLPFRIFSREGLIFVLTLHLYPLVFHTVAAALANMDASYEEAAGAAGAGKLRALAEMWEEEVVVVLVTRPRLGCPGAWAHARSGARTWPC